MVTCDVTDSETGDVSQIAGQIRIDQVGRQFSITGIRGEDKYLDERVKIGENDLQAEVDDVLDTMGATDFDQAAMDAWLDVDVDVEGEDTTSLEFFVVDQADNPLGSVIVKLTGKSSIVDLWAEDADGNIIGTQDPMRLNADSLGRQMPACFGLIGLTNETEVANRVAEAAEWVTTATGGYTRVFEMTPGKDITHVITYDDGAQTAIPLYVWEEDGNAYVRHADVKKPKNVSYETDSNADGEGYKRVIVARSGGLTHFIKFRVSS